AAQVTYQPPRLPLLSNLTGQFLPPDQTPDAAYWRNHLRQPVQFAPSIQRRYAQGCRLFLELGPAPVLLGMARRCLPEEAEAQWLPSLRPGRDEWTQMLESLAQLYTAGRAVDWHAFDQPYPRRRVHLPTY